MTNSRNQLHLFALTIALFAAGGFSVAAAELAAFNESFDGDGEYSSSGVELSGLDAPYWAVTLGGEGKAQIEDGSLRISNPGTQGGSYGLLTRHFGAGSFEETLELENVALGSPDSFPGSDTAQLMFIHTTDGSGSFQLMFSDDGGGSGRWTVALFADGSPVVNVAKKLFTVEAAKNIAIKTFWDQKTQQVTIFYDSDTQTDGGYTMVADFVYKGAAMRTGSTLVMAQRGVAGKAQASVDIASWQLKAAE